MTDTIDPDTVPTELRRAWSARVAAKLAASAGVKAQTRDGTVRWRAGSGVKVVAWRKRGRLYVERGPETVTVLTSRAGTPLETWGQLEALVAGLVPRASKFSDGEADACARMGGGL